MQSLRRYNPALLRQSAGSAKSGARSAFRSAAIRKTEEISVGLYWKAVSVVTTVRSDSAVEVMAAAVERDGATAAVEIGMSHRLGRIRRWSSCTK
ncbi:hypothetical protein DY000_02003747 [Brassica cretica]|uniref:Uncharacterized protein n=1 Tax=Brassica cretica TaxID=69181 RepID=A0ABQ7C4G9_BRACR|nr:hypothetical protein DY000_02003747 [Brassica cretica]